MDKKLLFLRVCDKITKYSIFALIFLMPIFFLPQTLDVLDFNKQSLLLFLVFVSLFAFIIKVFILGKFEIRESFIHVVAGILFLVYLLSTVFSIYKYGSFWGQPQQSSEGMLTVLCLLLFYFIVSNVFSKKDIFVSTVLFFLSAIIIQLISVLQLFGQFILPFSFTKSVVFNTVGSTGSLGIFTAIMLLLSITLIILAKKWWKILFILEIIISTLLLILINYPTVWYVVISGSVLIIILGIVRKNIFDGRWMALPMFFLVISLFFALLNPQINWLPQRIIETSLSQGTGFNIAMKAVEEKPIFGSGPGTFTYNFSKFKSLDFNKNSYWDVAFNRSSSKALNSLTTLGVIGFLAIFAFILIPIFYGIKFIIRNGDESVLLLGLTVALVSQCVAYFFYNSNIVLDLLLFFMIAVLVRFICDNKKEYFLKPHSWLTLKATFIFTLIFIFGMGLLVLNTQRYLAEVNYYKGLSAYRLGDESEGLKRLESAARLNPNSDLYFRDLSRAYLLELQDKMQNVQGDLSDDEKNRVQMLVSNSINAGEIATDINSKDVNNWSARGYVYQNLFGVLKDAEEWAIKSYDKALELDPNSPYLFFQEGSVYLASALNVLGTINKNELFVKAEEKLEKSISLKSDYANALYYLGIVYDSLGQKSKAIEVFTKLKQLNPEDENISKALENLMAGKSILQSPPLVENSLGETGEKNR